MRINVIMLLVSIPSLTTIKLEISVIVPDLQFMNKKEQVLPIPMSVTNKNRPHFIAFHCLYQIWSIAKIKPSGHSTSRKNA
jgi:hypothetical protein